MEFAYFCTGIVLFACIMAVGYMLGEMCNDCDFLMGWLFSSIGFAICLIILLIDHGII